MGESAQSYLRCCFACQDNVVKHEICWACHLLRHKPLELKSGDTFMQTPLRELHDGVLQAGIDVVAGEAPSPCRCMCTQIRCLKTRYQSTFERKASERPYLPDCIKAEAAEERDALSA